MANGNSENTKLIVYGSVAVIVVAFAYFGIINPLLQTLNLKRTKEEKKGDKDAEKLSRRQLLSPYLYQKNRNRNTISSGRASQLAKQIYEGESWGCCDDETKAVGALTSTGTKVNASYVAYMFNQIYGQGLYSFLEDGYLEPRHFTDIENYLVKVPKY